jgi:hypothetical protein
MIVIDPPSIREDLSKLVYDALGLAHSTSPNAIRSLLL